ncbi:MAG: leucine--tRNA ligase [Candidatus Aenigmatarchaeota archaeon]
MVEINYLKIQNKWQKKWKKAKIFEANVDKKRRKFFITFPYPYLNGSPHIGHCFSFFRADALARFKRMQGYNVLFPQGFHATGEPILGTIERLKKNDINQIETFKLFGATDKDLENFVKYGPEFVARYWMKRWIEDLKLGGYSADWRRTFVTAITPQYNRFIEWQYNTLRKKGYITQGTHPVVWCPHDQSPTGDHDRLEGIGEGPIEYIIIKFKLDSGEIIPTGTLRPETVYGVTNIWINPDVEYVWSKINNEVWLLSERAVIKLRDQLKDIQIIGKIKGSNLIGRYVENPVVGNKIIILPAKFVDPDSATGIVMSVPAHAPYDWIALKDLKENISEIKKYNLKLDVLEKIYPVSIITTEGFGEYPAKDFCEKFGVKNQFDKENLEKATSEVYKREYHLGILKDFIKPFGGKKVSEIKETLSNYLMEKGLADRMWELTGKVICRCTTPCYVKILENQWFLKFSDEKWKEKVRRCIASMKFYPEEVRIQFLNTVDWLKDKACARKSGLGTKLPWDKEWIVETLSDSTIYMAYYTISRIINEKKIPAEKLTDEVFDYIFLGKGNPKDISKKSKLDQKTLKEMREEFSYFYPVDMRTSGKDLVQNHLTFYLFHHTAIWDNQKYWPRAIAVNGFVNVEGTKMSKSKGNIIPLRDLIKKLGADIVRINIVSSNEDMDDANWRDENVASFTSRFEFLLQTIKNLKKAKRKALQNIDKFLLSKIQKIIEEITEDYEKMKFRSAIQKGFFEFINDLEYYIERCNGYKNSNQKVLKYALETITKILSPVTPHISEEFWFLLKNKNFVSSSQWPKYDKKLVNTESEKGEELIKTIISDINEIIKLTGRKPKEINIFIAQKWKFNIYNLVLKNKDKELKEIFKLLKIKDNKIIEYVQRLYKKRNELLPALNKEKQFKVLQEAQEFLKKKFKAKIKIQHSEDSKIEKAEQADVVKPAIYLV